MSKALGFYNLTGGLNTVQDLATINSTTNRTESPDMLNIEYYKLGGIQTMKGNKQIGSPDQSTPSDLDDIICGIEYVVGNDSYMLVANKYGRIYEYNKTSKDFERVLKDPDVPGNYLEFSPVYIDPDDPEPSLDEEFYKTVRIYATAYNNGIVFVNGKEALFYNKEKPELNNVWVPALLTHDSSTEPATEITTTFHPSVLASYRGRLFFGANEVEQGEEEYKGGMLFYSGVGLGTEEVWEESANTGEDAGAFKEFYEDSSNFTGLGIWSQYLVIHKQQGTYLLDGSGDLADEWELKPYSEYSVPSQQSFVIANNGYYSYIPEAGGIYSLLTRNIYNTTYQGGDLSQKVKDSFDYLDSTAYDKIFAVYHSRKKYIMFYMPMLDNLNSEGVTNGSSKCFIYDINSKTWLLRKVPQYVTCAFRFDNEVYIGTKDGLVLKEFSNKTFNGKPIDFYYLTPPFIWGGGTNKTTSKEFRAKLVNEYTNHFYIESFKDGVLSAKEQRLVKNTGDNVNGLFWDIGLNRADKNAQDYIPSNIFKYDITDSGGVSHTYYTNTKIFPIGDYRNVKVYRTIKHPDNDNTHWIIDNDSFINYYPLVNITVTGTEEDYNRIEYTTAPYYGWNERRPTDFCYRNGNYYAWVHQETGACRTNLKTETYTVWQGFKLEGNNNGHWRGTPSYYQSILSAQAGGATRNFIASLSNGQMQFYHEGTWKTSFYNGGTEFSAGIITNTRSISGSNANFVLAIYQPSYNLITPTHGFNNLPTDSFGTETATREVPSGTSPISNKGTQPTGVDSITINVIGVGNIRLTRYENGDIGSAISETNYYTKVKTGSNVEVYSDTACTVRYPDDETTGTINSNILTIGTVRLTRYNQVDGIRNIPNYYKDIHPDFSLVTPTEIPDAVEEEYIYPDDEDPIWEQTLTDTVWDYSNLTNPHTDEPDLPEGYTEYEDIPINLRGDGWLNQGYQTKRMLLPDQYFETVQFKFSGGGYDGDGNERYNDNICIGGFEVEGIQLAETPWK